MSKTGEKAERPVLEDRETLGHWASKKVENSELRAYQAVWNVDSLDGLPGLRSAIRDAGRSVWGMRAKAILKRVGGQREALALGFLVGVGVTMLLQWMWMR